MNSKSVFHVVNGDHPEGQLRQTSIYPDLICRECLVEGNVDENFQKGEWENGRMGE